MAWTKAQQKVIDTRHKNILVSAAAGSGKTAVLVERIISMVSEGEHPMDIDHLLVVTFTNAAAAEMRGRIGEALDLKLREQPDNFHLQKQLSLLQSAQITTIHSFCLNVIRNYFHTIDLDPSFKIADESEITLMKSDVISDILERYYEEGGEAFHAFIESYSYSKSDLPIEDLILQLYNFAMSAPWPKRWIEDKRSMFKLTGIEEMLQAPWIADLTGYVKAVLEDLLLVNEKALNLCHEPDGPVVYESALNSDRRLLRALLKADSYSELEQSFANISFERLSGKKQENVSEWKKDKVKTFREEVKKGIKDIQGQFFFQPSTEMLSDMKAVERVMEVLCELTIEFMEEFAKKKEEKNLIDFNDLEHFALRILVKESQDCTTEKAPSVTSDMIIPTNAALELSEQFDEILIDEYQDSNMVQETILKSISREREGIPNRFMVGDVKQSIYKFRLAMPEIFMEKFEQYSEEDLTGEGEINRFQRIDLDKNFRSRKEVLSYVNRIFEQIMQKSVGGVEYDQAASLKYGELFEETLSSENLQAGQRYADKTYSSEVELLLVTQEELKPIYDQQQPNQDMDEAIGKVPEESETDNPEEAIYTKREIEARAVARRIREFINPDRGLMIFDRKLGGHRPVQNKDIVILLRSMNGWAEVFVNTLMQEGIPAHADTGTGYFQTLEIMTILNMLRIIDNPRQDIPLTGILYSPIVGMTSTELAMIRAFSRNGSMYTALMNYMKEDRQEPLQDKTSRFVHMLESFRAMVNHKSIHELIQVVLDRTGYYHHISSMPGGEQRKANMDMLISQAVRFGKGSYRGLFHFIRYIEKLKKYDMDYGEASTSGEQDDTVRIMSIHKSKGLEFPVVFVAGMSKQFNMQDIRSGIVLHYGLGIGPEYIDSERRTKVPTLLKKVIQKKVLIENMGEELRVLYVAMTRAKEKLILSGYLDSPKDIAGRDFSFFDLVNAKCYMDWVLPATVNRIHWDPQAGEEGLVCVDRGVRVTIISQEKLLSQEISRQIFLRKDREALLSINLDKVYDQQARDEIKARFNYKYPYRTETGFKVKMTVSELKKLGQYELEEQSTELLPSIQHGSDEVTSIVPAFINSQESKLSGTDRGSLYHKVLELLNLRVAIDRETSMLELERMSREGYIKSSDASKLKQDYIVNFVMGDLARRMRLADIKGKLFKEKQFVIGIKASEVIPDSDSEQLILIQGIIDAYFEEEDELVLLDYKSDLVSNEEQLVLRYRVQLDYYRRALEQITGKRVKEMLIYSLPFGKEIRIE